MYTNYLSTACRGVYIGIYTRILDVHTCEMYSLHFLTDHISTKNLFYSLFIFIRLIFFFKRNFDSHTTRRGVKYSSSHYIFIVARLRTHYPKTNRTKKKKSKTIRNSCVVIFSPSTLEDNIVRVHTHAHTIISRVHTNDETTAQMVFV